MLKDWIWGRHLVIRDNLEDREFEILELIYHRSWKTDAKTEHYIEPGDAVEPIYNTAAFGKTHYTKIYRILRKPIKVKTIRVSNRGNETETEVVIQ